MDVTPVFGIPDSLDAPRRTEGIRALRFQVGAASRQNPDRQPARQYYEEPDASPDDLEIEAASEADGDPEESPEISTAQSNDGHIHLIA
ncbi:MAG TPA: hypothetical protein VG893_08190 [Terracidiphilus sp.]|nr:hypothetical protein [Terracidiphilus sp.]